jgi:OmpA-OmpF porin, OOP family
MKKIVATALLSALITAPVAAQDMYIGGNIGKAQIDAPGLDSSIAFSVLGGYTFNSNLAAEVAFINFGSADLALGATAKSSALNVSGVASYPINDLFSLIGKMGVALTTLKVTGSDSASKMGLTFGVGAQYNFDDQIGMRASYDVYNVGGAITDDEEVLSIGAIFKF